MHDKGMTPPGFHTATPYLSIEGAARAIEFYKTAFGATDLERHSDPDGRIRHAQFKIGDSPFMISDYFGEYQYMKSVQMYGGSPVNIFLYVDDADAVFQQALAAGAKQLTAMADLDYGRSGGVTDPFGIQWWLCTAPSK